MKRTELLTAQIFEYRGMHIQIKRRKTIQKLKKVDNRKVIKNEISLLLRIEFRKNDKRVCYQYTQYCNSLVKNIGEKFCSPKEKR